MTAFLDVESTLVGMVSRNLTLSELTSGGGHVSGFVELSQGRHGIFSPPAQFLPLIPDMDGVLHPFFQESSRGLEPCLGCFHSYLRRHCGDLLAVTVQRWASVPRTVCILKTLSYSDLGKEADNRILAWRV